MHRALFAVLLAASPSAAQEPEPPALRFVGTDAALSVTTDEMTEVLSMQEGDRFIILVQMQDAVGERFADLTEATEGDPLTVQLCGRGFLTITGSGRVEGGRVKIPAPDLTFADRAAEVFRGEATCSDILSF